LRRIIFAVINEFLNPKTMKILTTTAYRKLVNLCDSLSEKLYNEKTTTSLLLHENFELQKRVQELEKKLSRNTKRDAKGLFIPNTPTIAKISATMNTPKDIKIKTSGLPSYIRILAEKVKEVTI
jgi:hypothetical protein